MSSTVTLGDFPEFDIGDLDLGGTGGSDVLGSFSVVIGTVPGGTGGVAKAPAAVLSEFIDAVALKRASLPSVCLSSSFRQVCSGDHGV
jgi:hypothetical protein